MSLFTVDTDTAWPLVKRIAKKGACRGDKTFFARPLGEQKTVCRACPVAADCHLLALNPEDYTP